MLKFQFLEPENKQSYFDSVLSDLKKDFKKNKQPQNHFWHNRSTISDAFDNCQAMVACDGKNKVVGWMIWSLYDIVEVKKEHRQKGIFSTMLAAFTDKFSHLAVLSAHVIPQAQAVFARMGWQAVPINHGTTFFKTLRECLPSLDNLSDGLVIAVNSENYYQVLQNPDNYAQSMRYFKLDIDEAGILEKPIVIPCSHEGYIGIYRDKILVKTGKAKHFEDTVSCHSGLVIIQQIALQLLAECQRRSITLKRSGEDCAEITDAIIDAQSAAIEENFDSDEKLMTIQCSSSLWKRKKTQQDSVLNKEYSFR